MSNKRQALIAVLGLLGITIITVGAAYAWFSYSKSGTKENTISAGTIKFHYEEGNSSIKLVDAVPMTDSQGMAQAKAFDFTITSSTSSTVAIPYYVTVRRSANSDINLDSHVKVYLTKVNGSVETPVVSTANKYTSKFSELGTYTNSSITIPASEKALYTSTVPVNSSNYRQTYRLRMWIDENTDFSAVKKYYCGTTEITQAQYENTEYPCASGEKNMQDVYPYNNDTYTLTVNVYSEGTVAQATTVPTISSCPGCRFVYNLGYTYHYGANGSTLTTNDTVADYTSLNSDRFLGFILSDGDHGKIERAFVCGIKRESTEAALETGTPFCLEGHLDNSHNMPSTDSKIVYQNNKQALQSLSLWDSYCVESDYYNYNYKLGNCNLTSIRANLDEKGYVVLYDINITYGVENTKCLVLSSSDSAVCRVES